MLHHPLTNFKIQKYYKNKPKFNGVYSRNNLPKIKDGAYVINLDKHKSIRTHWIDLYVNGNKMTYFDIAIIYMFYYILELNMFPKKF